MKNNTIFKRIIAYFIDAILVMFISSALSYISFINPKYEEYQEASSKYNELLTEYYEHKIDINELTEKSSDISYEISKTGYVYIIGSIIIAFLYYGVFAYVTDGQTLGKRIMGLKTVSNKEGGKLKIYNYFIRTLILNGVILNVITLIAICFNKNTYYTIYNNANTLNMILMILIFLTVMFTKDNRGIHDYLAGTKVIDIKNAKEEVEEAQIKEVPENKKEDSTEDTKTIEKEETEVIKPKTKTKKTTEKKGSTKEKQTKN